MNDEDYFDTLDDCINKSLNKECYPISDYVRGRVKLPKPKVEDLKPIAFVNFNERPKNAKPRAVVLKTLLDTGASATLISAKYAKKLKKLKSPATIWTTPNGDLTTNSRCRAQFSIPELHDNRLL